MQNDDHTPQGCRWALYALDADRRRAHRVLQAHPALARKRLSGSAAAGLALLFAAARRFRKDFPDRRSSLDDMVSYRPRRRRVPRPAVRRR